MKISDLHRHLDGSVRPATLAEFAHPNQVPTDLAFHKGMGLAAALGCFAYVLKHLKTPDRVRLVAAEMCEDAVAEGVTTLEIRFAPQLHTGASPEAIVDAVLAGIDGRAGLILCGLYGEDPKHLAKNLEIALTRPGVVAIDLAGGPQLGQGDFMQPYAASFRRAADAGLGRTAHAGEGRPAAEIRQAIEVLGVQRIGHGTTLLSDPAVLDLVLENDVVIEACPTSNVHTSAIESVADHPVAQWLDAGVKVAICADNTLFSEVTAADELRKIRAVPGIDDAAIETLVAMGHAAAFQR